VNTCTGSFRRRAWWIPAVGGLAGLLSGIAAIPATADAVTDRQAQAQALATQIEALGNKEAALSEQYDKTVLDAETVSRNVRQASDQVSVAETNTAKARSVLTANAVDAYVNGGTLAQLASRATNPMAATDTLVLRGEYVHSLAGTQSDALDAYRHAAVVARAAQAELQVAQKQAQKALADVDNARNATIAAQRKLEASLGQVKGEMATLVAQAQAANQAEASRQAATLLAAQRTATSQTAGPTGNGGRLAAAPLPAVGRGARAAVAAALSRVGLPYVWGAAGPSAFDCSGLTMWAWAQAGVSLPHFSGAQYAAGQHIPISQVQPGDLVFFSNPGEHEAMYIGGGQIVEAAHSGVPVRVIPLYGQFVLASRP
jgi:cell wall-associated NlpC family hydrolase